MLAFLYYPAGLLSGCPWAALLLKAALLLGGPVARALMMQRWLDRSSSRQRIFREARGPEWEWKDGAESSRAPVDLRCAREGARRLGGMRGRWREVWKRWRPARIWASITL